MSTELTQQDYVLGTHGVDPYICATLLEIVNKLIAPKYGPSFARPVDPINDNVPNYFTVIKYPMDLGTIRKNVLTNSYTELDQFLKDMITTLQNCMDFNQKESGIYKAAEFLLEYFTIRCNATVQRISEGRVLQPDPDKADVSIGKKEEVLKTPKKTKPIAAFVTVWNKTGEYYTTN